MRFAHRWLADSKAQAGFETAIVLPICIYAFFMLMEICFSLYAGALIKATAEKTLHFVQENTAADQFYSSGVDANELSSDAGRFADAYFAQSSLNPIGTPPNTCVSWWQPGTVVGPNLYQNCASSGGGVAGDGDPNSSDLGVLVAVQVTWRYHPWLSHFFPVTPTFTYTAVGPAAD